MSKCLISLPSLASLGNLSTKSDVLPGSTAAVLITEELGCPLLAWASIRIGALAALQGR